jgi:branched-chain amino acid transport system ATP-binding protein
VPTSAPEPLLEVAGLSAGYGKIVVLRDVALTIGAGEAVALLGPNGAGKTTLLRAVSGLLPRTGQVKFAGRDMAGAGPGDTVKAGLVHVVEGHRVFTQLSVFDNLLLAGYGLSRAELTRQVEEALAFFPEIAAKRNDRAVTLSGGQQQMLAVAQGLVRKPRLLMLDEPSAGLSPVLVDRVLAAMVRLREAGTARSCCKREPTRPTCPTGWSMPISARMSARPSLHNEGVTKPLGKETPCRHTAGKAKHRRV